MTGEAARKPAGTKGLVSWCFYDWANSAFPTVITTFVFSAYFTQGVATDPVSGTADWGWMMSLSAIGVAIMGPLLGSVADHTGKRKPWLLSFTILCAVFASALWTVEPEPGFAFRALVLVGLANFAFEMGMVFYNAMLADISPEKKIGRWSGWGWALGYLGGLSCLALTLAGFVQSETPWFGLDKSAAEHLRATGPLVGLWIVVFALPLFLWTPDKPSLMPVTKAVLEGLSTLVFTLKNMRHYRTVVHFLVARMIYTDGLNTLFAFGGIYAAGSFGFSFENLIIFGIIINVTAGLGAAGFAWIDDLIGPKPVIVISISALILLSSSLLLIESPSLFWVIGSALGIFVGPAQSASRSLMARLAPEPMRTEMFGLYALSGKATAFLGPALLAMMTLAFDSQRAGMASIVIFFAFGLFLLLRLKVTA